MIRGPRAQDRVLALDALYVNTMLLFLTLGIRTGTVFFFEAALVIAHARLRRHGGARQVPDARRGDRMSHLAAVPLWAAIPAALLLVVGAGLTLIGCLGLVRFSTLLRAHPCADARHQLGRRRHRPRLDHRLLGRPRAAPVLHETADRLLRHGHHAGHADAARPRRALPRPRLPSPVAPRTCPALGPGGVGATLPCRADLGATSRAGRAGGAPGPDSQAAAGVGTTARFGASDSATLVATMRAVAADRVQPRWPWPVL